MPMRDHFRPPLDDFVSWDDFHGQWPAQIVQELNRLLPEGFAAAPHVRLGSPHEYEVRVYDFRRGRRLVAAVEIVGPSNKDRPEHCRAFAAKCGSLLREQVSVAIVDLVTNRDFNLYRDVLELIGDEEPAEAATRSAVYAASCRFARGPQGWALESWARPLLVGVPLPTLPLWISEDRAMPLDPETTYQATAVSLRLA